MGFAGKVMEGSGVEIYYIIGILIFVSLFVVILVRTMRMKKTDLNNFKNAILEDGEVADSKS